MTMASADLTCSEVEREELDLKYLRGQLSQERAEAFEAHYFGCESCWELVHRGAELRASRAVRPRRRLALPWTLLAAAVLVGAVGLGLWRSRDGGIAPGPDSERGDPGTALVVRASADSASLSLAWNPVADAAGYRVRLFLQDGTLLTEREGTDTSLVLARADLNAPGRYLWLVLALDRLGGELVRSGLIDAEPPPASRAP